MSTVHIEQVMVVPTELFRETGYFQGFSHEPDRYLNTLLDPLHTSYRPRSEMETDPNFKQLIPYVIFRFVENQTVNVFQYTRGKGQGETRLHAKSSVGIGGHISTLDEGNHDPYVIGMQRELDEEVIIETDFSAKCVGLINDDSNEVGQVHLGIVHIYDVQQPAIRAREDDILAAEFRRLDDILSRIDQFETWSQICLRALFEDPAPIR